MWITLPSNSQMGSRREIHQSNLKRPLLGKEKPGTRLRVRWAAFFRFLRQPSRPIAPMPVAKSGRAAEEGYRNKRWPMILG